jgi:hypothetical protein
MESRILGAMKTRRERLAGLRAWQPAPISEDARIETRDRLAHAKDAITDDSAEPEVPNALDAEEAAWTVYRDAEIALYETLHFDAHEAAALLVATEHADALGEFEEGEDP